MIIVGLKGMHEETSMGRLFNRMMHLFPVEQICPMLLYKLVLSVITLVRQEESYTSQCRSLFREVSRRYPNPRGLLCCGLYKDGSMIWHADSIGVFNIIGN